MSYLKNILRISAFIFFVASCTENKTIDTTVNDGVEVGTKDIHDVGSDLASAPGEELVRMHCLTCHSLRYIQMQPAFPRKTWEKLVGKMVKNFGAPIPDSTAKEIVDYLVAVKGRQ
ncbi:hypothetical protein BH11BAC1_BH11BAC1_12050 [soil metagenome]